ncbi:hypothetical protein AZL_014020 [Azospirillum sp. B510]|uniref:DUF2268 domain-containing putative Zn-dependent protease n=1 Tax=Azospirillum sp. (strain B510) TaxID=137722 RepID=UPI0001C4C395|nr:DUF2268 domain-containing putative Zn-dependent protease [Azospirillum sp. B510]BAI72040.1 hypothetical protein AZL_014020 [Azospirillum sp. B510]
MAIRWTPHFLEAQGSLDGWRTPLLESTGAAMERIADHLPDLSVDLLFEFLPDWAIPELGIGGRTPRIGLASVALDPDNRDFSSNIDIPLKKMWAHELHHCARFATHGYSRHFEDALISEGLADHFAREIFGGEGELWNHALTNDQTPALFQRAKALLGSTRYDYNGWFFGDREADLPRWTGYTLGYRMISHYLERRGDMTAGGAHAVPSADILSVVSDLFEAP